MSPVQIAAILSGAFSVLRSGGSFYQFTYGPRCPVPRSILDTLGLQATRIGGTVRNLPPASVYRISRRKGPEMSIGRADYRGKSFDAASPLVAAERASDRGLRDNNGLGAG
jgi:hypothetical protein